MCRLFTNNGVFSLLKILGNVCGAKKLVGPKGKITSPNFPNSYNNNDYCRWKIAVAKNQKVSLNIKILKTVDTSDRLELYDGVSGSLLTVLSGFITNPIRITSDSNILDVKFVSDRLNVADGFQAEYDGASERPLFYYYFYVIVHCLPLTLISVECFTKTSSGNAALSNNFFVLVCGGHITSIGQTIQTPNYPSNYPIGTTCTWQIHVPVTKLLVKFERFLTYDVHDKLEAWNSITTLSCKSQVVLLIKSCMSF